MCTQMKILLKLFNYIFYIFKKKPLLLFCQGAKEALDLGISGPEGIEISRPEEV